MLLSPLSVSTLGAEGEMTQTQSQRHNLSGPQWGVSLGWLGLIRPPVFVKTKLGPPPWEVWV